MVSRESSPSLDACILDDVQPLLSELKESIQVDAIDEAHPSRRSVETFVHDVFAARYRANVQSFYPTLLSFRDGHRQRAVVGLREAAAGPLFAEHYLDTPVERMIAGHFEVELSRDELVEVGNLALDNPGDARWAIAATIEFLNALGYRWVLFTATRVLINAFQRLGMRPVPLAAAQPGLLGDQARQWGDYYRAAPLVCAGHIGSGHHKLHRHGSHAQPVLEGLLVEMARLAERWQGLGNSRQGGR